MLTFKEYIAESGDSSYEFHKTPVEKPHWAAEAHRYSFKDSSGSDTHVDIVHRIGKLNHRAYVSFHSDYLDHDSPKYSANGKHGHKALKVFSTVKAILAHHAKTNPGDYEYSFTADKEENNTRSSLYTRMTKKMKGNTEDLGDVTTHTIPAKHMIEQILESGDSSYPFRKIPFPNSPRWADSSHKYTFKDENGSTKHVEIHHQSFGEKPNALVTFHNKDSDDISTKHAPTGKHGHKAVKVFSTIKSILSHHAKKHPELDHFEFSSSIHEPSRIKAYTSMTNRMDGKTHYDYDQDAVIHTIPTQKLK